MRSWTKYEFPGDDIPRSAVYGSALKATQGDDGEIGKRQVVLELMGRSTPTSLSLSVRHDLDFLMPIEDVFSIQGRGTVVTGRVERGIIHVGDKIEIVGIKETTETTCTGVEMFRKLLDQGRGWRQLRHPPPRHQARRR